MSQHGPRDIAAVLETRYWLTDKGHALLEANNKQRQQPDPSPTSKEPRPA